MKKILAVILSLMILGGGAAALADGLTEYSGEHYSFQHPEEWKREATQDGTVILQSPDGSAYVRGDILLTDLFSFTGDEEADATFIKAVMQSFAGEGTDGTEPTLLLDGTYELITAGELKGFRAPGTWRPTGDPALLDVLTGGGAMVSFTMVGNPAIELEETLTSSLRIAEGTTETENGMKKWENEKISLWYPETFKMMGLGQNGGVVFTELSANPSLINVMTSEMPDVEYTIEFGLESIGEVLKQAGGDTVQSAEIREIGGRQVVYAEGSAGDTPGAICVMGQGKTVAVLNFAGENAVKQAETVIGSVQFK